jgi:hypothetical protein
MRYLLLLFTFIASPVFAMNPYCACQQVPDPLDPYLRDPSVQAYLLNVYGVSSGEVDYDCYGINSSGGLGPISLCIDACYPVGISLVPLGMQQLVNSADCDPTHSGNIPTPDPPPDPTGQGCTGSNCGTTGGTGGSGGSSDSPPFPCGYPGAQYLDCNVYDARVEAAVKNTTSAVNSVKTSVDTVNTSVGAVKTSVDAVKTSVDGVKTSVDAAVTELKAQTTEIKAQTTEIKAQTTEIKAQTVEEKAQTVEVKKTNDKLDLTNGKLDAIYKQETDYFQKLENAMLHKGVTLNVGACAETASVYDKLPALSTITNDATLVGFSCTGDLVLCSQLKIQAQSFCRDVISQRLQAMYLNGGNVFVSCSPGYVGQLSDAGSPVCHLKTGNCLLAGQQPSPGNNYPPCDIPTTVTCPSAEFVPVVIAGGFSCDTKLAAGKFNAQIAQTQQLIDTLKPDARLAAVDTKTQSIVAPVVDQSATDTVNLDKAISKSGAVSLSGVGVNQPGQSDTIEGLYAQSIFSAGGFSIFGYVIPNPFDLLTYVPMSMITPFTKDITNFFISSSSGCTLDFSPIEAGVKYRSKIKLTELLTESRELDDVRRADIGKHIT